MGTMTTDETESCGVSSVNRTNREGLRPDVRCEPSDPFRRPHFRKNTSLFPQWSSASRTFRLRESLLKGFCKKTWPTSSMLWLRTALPM